MSRRRSAGFTLLELTVSLGIAALAMGALAHVVQDAASFDTRLSRRLQATGEAEALFTLLDQLLSNPQRELSGEALQLSGSIPGPTVSGSAREIRVVSRGPRILGLSEPTLFTLRFEGGEPSGRVRLEWLYAEGAGEPETVTASRGFELRYGALSGNAIDWTDYWSRPVAELAMVEAAIVEPTTGRRLSRVIPVVATLPRICALRPLLEGCPEWRSP